MMDHSRDLSAAPIPSSAHHHHKILRPGRLGKAPTDRIPEYYNKDCPGHLRPISRRGRNRQVGQGDLGVRKDSPRPSRVSVDL